MGKSEDKASKHLKSKSQSNFSSENPHDKSKKYKQAKIRKNDIYAQNFSSTDYYKHKIERENKSKITSPGSEEQKSPMRTISNFNQMKKVIKKVNQSLKGSRPQYGRKTKQDSELIKNNSLIAESGWSGFFGNGKNKGKINLNIRFIEHKDLSGARKKEKPFNKEFEERMNFYPSPNDPATVDYSSLEYHDAKEEFKVTRLRTKNKDKSFNKITSPDLSKEDVQAIPEYYFDLTKMGDKNKMDRESKRMFAQTERLGHNVHFRK